jgi:hypothetical protein
VRDVMAVAKDLQAGSPGRLAANDRAGHAELLRQVEAVQVRGRDVPLKRRQSVVELALVGRVPVGGKPTELAGGENVERGPREVDPGPRGGDDQQARDERREDAGDECSHHQTYLLFLKPPTSEGSLSPGQAGSAAPQIPGPRWCS